MKKNSGQVAVFVMLVMLLGLTVGLSITSRTLQDLKQSSITDQSSRAFTAAEAGIETALATTLVAGQNIPYSVGGVSGTYSVSQNPSTEYTPDKPVAKDDVIAINLDGYAETAAKNINIYWSKNSIPSEVPACSGETDAPAALELSFYTKNGSTYGVTRMAYNASTCGVISSLNNFTVANSGGSDYLSMVSVSAPQYTKLLRIRPIYNNASIKITPSSGTLPAQAYTITATATAGEAQRSVQVTRSFGALPPIFDYVLFSGTAISQ